MSDGILRATCVHRVSDDGEEEALDSVWVRREDGIARADEINSEGFDATYQSIAVYTNPFLLRDDIDAGGDWWESQERQVAKGAA